MEIVSVKPLLALLISAAASVLILFSGKRPNLREFWTVTAALVKTALVLSLYPWIRSGHTVVWKLGEIFPDTGMFLRVDALGFTFAAVASALWILTSVYSIGYMRSLKEKDQTRYFFSFALSLSATLGIAFAGDLLTFFIFFEILAVVTYPLVTHKQTDEAIKAGRKYLVYSLSAGGLLLLAILWTYHATGNLNFTPGGFLSGLKDSRMIFIIFFLFIYGCGVKAALFPLHAWLPSAMVAPTPVSALLHAVAVVKAGVFGILRITGFVFGPSVLKETGLGDALGMIAGFTILGASFMALAQENLKRRLAYSTISQLSYIILGSALASQTAYTGAVLHLGNHAMMKIALFFAAGAIYCRTHCENISDLKGLGYRMPFTFTAFTIGAVGLSGFPLFSGFISKWMLCMGAIDSHHGAALAIYLSSALLNLLYLLPIVIIGFSRSAKHEAVEEKPWTLWVPPIIAAAAVLAFGSVPAWIQIQKGLADLAAASVFMGGMP